MGAGRRLALLQSVDDVQAGVETVSDDVVVVLDPELLDCARGLEFVEIQHVGAVEAEAVDGSLAQMTGERPADVAPDAVQIDPGPFLASDLDLVRVSGGQFRGLHADRAHADGLDLQQPLPEVAVAVSLDQVLGGRDRDFAVFESAA